VVPTVVRVASEATNLGKYHIAKGTTIMVNIHGVHSNPELWPEPHVYRPSRFHEELKPFTFLPFVDGPRMCLGQFLSLLESKVVVSLLVKKFRFELTNPEDAGQRHPYMVPMIPKTGHFFKIYSRDSASLHE
jgi:beta-ring hydroxylase